MTDSQRLLAEYAKNGSESAFRELVERYIKWSHSKFQGTISGDTIKGKVEREPYLGNNHTLDWEAKRVAKP